MQKVVYKTNFLKLLANVLKITIIAIIAISLIVSAFKFLNERDTFGLATFIILFGLSTFFFRWLAKVINFTLLNTVYFTIDNEKIIKHYPFRRRIETCFHNDITGYSGNQKNRRNSKQKISLYLNDGRVIEIKDDSIEGFRRFKDYIMGGGFTYLGLN